MYKIQTLNAISDIIYTQLSADHYTVAKEEPVPDGILVRSAAMHDMALGENLLAIARAGAGVNNIPIDKCSAQGICVFNTPGANANAVAELVLCGLLLGSRNVVGGVNWAAGLKAEGDAVPKLVEKGKGQFVGPELRGKTLGVIGLGAIGRLVANAASEGFGMRVVGYDPFISVESAWALSSKVIHAKSDAEVLAQADYVTIHVPLNDKTRSMFNADVIAKMKPGAVLLNFSRNELAVNADVLSALESGQLGGYVVDFPSADLLGVEKVVAIPHLGASTPESEENCASMAAAQLRDYLEFGSIHNSVNLPEVALGRPEGARVLVIHENIPNSIATITACVSAEGINITDLTNKSKKDMAVTVMDIPDLPTEAALEKIRALPGVRRVRTFA
ncbi:MAG: 3-phosphoglycerate dehydrogenase family protein [Clostridiales bacterium]|nr:3-phosphoglycerate dehydrogenase family protein [Clostridiales bacterium]